MTTLVISGLYVKRPGGRRRSDDDSVEDFIRPSYNAGADRRGVASRKISLDRGQSQNLVLAVATLTKGGHFDDDRPQRYPQVEA
jgi:hypothetical protein